MLGKQKSYIISPNQVDPTDVELVGTRAISIQHVSNLGILVPEYFVISSVSFDDFIIASGLVERISAALAKLNSDGEQSAEKVSEEITNLIGQAVFPSTLLHPIIQAYKSLSGISDKYVELTPSYIYTNDLVPKEDEEFVVSNVKGEAALLYSVKQVWARLFSKQSLLHRFSKGYRSGLSIAIVVRKAIQAESSGVAYSLDPIGHSRNSILIEALLGLRTEHNFNETYDIYRLDSSDGRIVEKNISSQEKMYVRKAKIENPANSYLTVPISLDWRRRQKLDDAFITDIGRKIQRLKQDMRSDIEIEWSYEVGKVFVTSISKYEALDFNKLASTLPQPELETELEFVQDVPEVEDIELPKIDIPEMTKPQLKLRPKLDIKKLVTEVNDIVDGKIDIPATEELEIKDEAGEVAAEEVSEPATEFKEEFKLMTNMYLDVSSLDTEYLVEAARFDGIYIDGTELVKRHHVLAENIEDKAELSHLIESYALDISTAARAVNPKPILFAFSDLNSEGKSDGFDGSERFIEHPESLITELFANRKASSLYEVKNISYVIPRPRSLDEISDVKKILNSVNMKRTKSSQLLAEVSLPIFSYQISEIDSGLVDGVIINLTKLLPQLLGTNKVTASKFSHAMSLLENICLMARSKGVSVSIKIGELQNVDLEKILSLNADNLIFSEIPSVEVLSSIQAADKDKLSELAPVKTRGRKIKPL